MSQDSPCIGICEIDESGYCVGCGRSADEIFGETDSAPAGEEAAVEVVVPVVGPAPGDSAA